MRVIHFSEDFVAQTVSLRSYMHNLNEDKFFNSVILEKTPMRLGNRIYRVWEELELPKYFLNLHQNAPTDKCKRRNELRDYKRSISLRSISLREVIC